MGSARVAFTSAQNFSHAFRSTAGSFDSGSGLRAPDRSMSSSQKPNVGVVKARSAASDEAARFCQRSRSARSHPLPIEAGFLEIVTEPVESVCDGPADVTDGSVAFGFFAKACT